MTRSALREQSGVGEQLSDTFCTEEAKRRRRRRPRRKLRKRRTRQPDEQVQVKKTGASFNVNSMRFIFNISVIIIIIFITTTSLITLSSSSPQAGYHNGFQLYSPPSELMGPLLAPINQSSPAAAASSNQQQQVAMVTSTPTTTIDTSAGQQMQNNSAPTCSNGLLTFELSTGFIYKPSSVETLAMMPSTLQLTDCLDYCLQNVSCLAINFEMGLCVLLSSSAKQNPTNLYSSQFPVFTIYAEKKCLLSGDSQAPKQRRRCQRAWTFERVAGYEMKTRPKKRLRLASKEHCMEACLLERDFECRSANWYRQTGECTLSDQDRHSVSQSEAGDQQVKLHDLYGPSNLTGTSSNKFDARVRPTALSESLTGSLYQNYYMAGAERLRNMTSDSADWAQVTRAAKAARKPTTSASGAINKYRQIRQLEREILRLKVLQPALNVPNTEATLRNEPAQFDDNNWPMQYNMADMPANALVDYLENNCVYEPNKLCEFRKIQNRVLKTVDSIYQDVMSLDECKQKCLNAPYRCYSFDYGDTSERVCRTSHLDQASLLSVKEPYLDVVGAITYELASCFNVSIQCKAREMVALVSSSKTFKGKIYVKSRPNSCVNDVHESLQFELAMKYHDENCDVHASSNSKQGVFSNDIVIQHHDRIITTQDVGLSVYCQYDLGNRSITNNVDLAIERLDESIESKTQPNRPPSSSASSSSSLGSESGSVHSPLTITSLATTVVRSPNVTMRITNMNGQPVTSATVGDRLALLFEIKEKSSPFGIFVREIIAMDGQQLIQQQAAMNPLKANSNGAGSQRDRLPAKPGSPANAIYHYSTAAAALSNATTTPMSLLTNENSLESFQANKANSIQFIDSQGCPTDSNIMGPLVRMDQSGHRILAPFDAFKFPTSDMVFFRAVVSSCIADCKQLLCQPNDVAATFAPTSGGQRPGASSSVAPEPQHHYLASTSRNMPTRPPPASSGGASVRLTSLAAPLDETPPAVALSSEPPLGRRPAGSGGAKGSTEFESISTTLATSGFTATPSTVARSSAAGSFEALPAHNKTNASVETDSLTTVPGFQAHLDSSAGNNSQHVNMTNNHYGKAPPRPTGQQAAGGEKSLVPIIMDAITNPRQQELLQGIVSALKQQLDTLGVNGSQPLQPVQVASMYSGLLASPTMRGLVRNVSASFNKAYLSTPTLPPMAEFVEMILRAIDLGEKDNLAPPSNNLAEQAGGAKRVVDMMYLAEVVSQIGAPLASDARLSQTPLGEWLADVVKSANEIRRSAGQQQELRPRKPPPLIGDQQLREEQELAANQKPAKLVQPIDEPIFVDHNDLTPGGSNLDSVNSTVAKLTTGQQVSGLQTAQQTFDRAPNLSQTSEHLGKPQIGAQQQATGSGLTPTGAVKLTAAKSALEAQSRRKTRDKSAQMFADSYLGAFQRPRKRRSTDTKALRSAWMGNGRGRDRGEEHQLTPAYVYLEQPQWLTVAPSEMEAEHRSADERPMRFTQAIVEMYHTAGERSRRLKRESQPFYDVDDELVVQSIKIVDRLEFDEQQRRAKEGATGAAPRHRRTHNANGKQSLPRSSLITHSPPTARNGTATSRQVSLKVGHSHLDEESQEELVGGSDDDYSPIGQQYYQRTNWTGSGALSLLVVALSFILVQLFLVLVCLLDWSRKAPSSRIERAGARGERLSRFGGQQVLLEAQQYAYGCSAGTLSRRSMASDA